MDRKTAPADPYLSLRELAHYSGLSIRTLRTRLVDLKDPLPHYRVGGKVLVKRSEFDLWVQRFKRVSVGALDSMVDDILKTLVS